MNALEWLIRFNLQRVNVIAIRRVIGVIRRAIRRDLGFIVRRIDEIYGLQVPDARLAHDR